MLCGMPSSEYNTERYGVVTAISILFTVIQADAVEKLKTTISDISIQVHENARDAKDAAERADIVKNQIEQSNQGMNQMIRAMTEINDCASAISRIIANNRSGKSGRDGKRLCSRSK